MLHYITIYIILLHKIISMIEWK